MSRVIDGDTLITADGRVMRVLGIDACELGTPAGDVARDQASAQLATPGAQSVVLRTEPGVDRTPDGLLLRHVEVRGSDWGRQAVPYEHTGAEFVVGAPTAYVDELRALDTRLSTSTPPVARVCEGPAPTTTTTESTTTTTADDTATDNGDPDRRYRPNRETSNDDSDGGSSRGSGSSGSSGDGHPCRPGERDGDGDGLCGES